MILEFSVKNYLSFKEEQTLSFESTSDKTHEKYYCKKIGKHKILKTAMIYGPNASGKTNLLKAMNFLRNCALNTKEKDDKTDFIPFLFDKKTQNEPGIFKIVFFIEKIKYEYELILDKERIYKEILKYYPKNQPATIYKRISHDNKYHYTFGSTINYLKTAYKDALETQTTKTMTTISAWNKIDIELPELEKVYQFFKNEFLPIIEPTLKLQEYTFSKLKKSSKLKDFVIKMLEKADFNISNLKHYKNEIEVNEQFLKELKNSNLPDEVIEDIKKQKTLKLDSFKFAHKLLGQTYRLSKNLESAGTMRTFGIAAPFYELLTSNRILTIDELESSLHPKLVNYLLNSFLVNSNYSQLIFTTHNLNIMADPDEIRRDVIWFTELDKSGGTNLFSLADFSSKDIRKNMNYLKAYKSGKFGAIPKFGSIFWEDSNG